MDFSNEILHNILEYMIYAKDIYYCILVCRNWNDIIQYFNKKYTIDIYDIKDLLPAAKLYILQNTSVKDLLVIPKIGNSLTRVMFSGLSFKEITEYCFNKVKDYIKDKLEMFLDTSVSIKFIRGKMNVFTYKYHIEITKDKIEIYDGKHKFMSRWYKLDKKYVTHGRLSRIVPGISVKELVHILKETAYDLLIV